MAVCRIVETGRTPDEYDQVRERVGMTEEVPPGGVFHIAGVGDDGKVRVLELWHSREAADAWMERVRAARSELGISDAPQVTYLEVHRSSIEA